MSTAASAKRKLEPSAQEAESSSPRPAKRARGDHESVNPAIDMLESLIKLYATDVPDAPEAWPKHIWDALFNHAPNYPGGDYFALPILDEWLRLVSSDVLASLHEVFFVDSMSRPDPLPFRVEVRQPAELGKHKLLAITFSESGSPKTPRHVLELICASYKLELWYLEMKKGSSHQPLDEFVRKRIVVMRLEEVVQPTFDLEYLERSKMPDAEALGLNPIPARVVQQQTPMTWDELSALQADLWNPNPQSSL